MSFTDQNGVMLLVEELLSFIWPSELGKIKTPFPRMSYEEAMLKYGSDKPDIGRSTKVIFYLKYFLALNTLYILRMFLMIEFYFCFIYRAFLIINILIRIVLFFLLYKIFLKTI